MNTGQTLFNAVGIVIAGFLLFAGLVSLSDFIRADYPRLGDDFWFLFFVLDCVLVFLIGGGSLANLANHRLNPWPTLAVIAGYILTLVLLPIAVWGIVLLVQEQKRHRKRRSHFD